MSDPCRRMSAGRPVAGRCPGALLVFILASAFAAPAAAQDSHWGIGAGWAPTWKSVDTFSEKTMDWHGSLEGREFTIGIVRGSTRGGEWGVSFVQKPFEDGSRSVETDEQCDEFSCTTTTVTQVMRDVQLRGVEFHWFKPFGTIADRVQIGLNLAGGIAQPRGTIDLTFDTSSVITNPFTGEVFRIDHTNTFAEPANELLYVVIPLFKVEVQAAIIVAPGFKLKVAGGVNNPGAGVRIGATYLIGAR